VFDRFNDQASRIIVDAQLAAAGMGHHFVGPEHFLIALTRDMDTAVRVKATRILRSNGFHQDESRELIRAFHDAPGEPYDGKVPFTPQAKTVLDDAWRLADSFHHRQINAEHLLLAITALPDGAAITVLGMFCTVADVRAHLVDWLTHLEEDPAPASA
jgi:ATP-dependent Clp protease ATP-binding subunit ClpC